MAVVNYYLKDNDVKKSKPTLIFLSFYFDGKRLRISTKEKILAKNFNFLVQTKKQRLWLLKFAAYYCILQKNMV